MVVASKVPPAMVRNNTPSGNSPEKPGTRSGSPPPVATITSAKENSTGSTPCARRGRQEPGLVPIAVIGRQGDAHGWETLDGPFLHGKAPDLCECEALSRGLAGTCPR